MHKGKFDASLPLTNKWLQDTFSNLVTSQDAANGSSVDMTLLIQVCPLSCFLFVNAVS